MQFSTWLAFFVASWAISISPGSGAVAAMSAGLNHGFRRGYITTLGLVLGIWTQLAVVAMGLGAVVATSPWLFNLVKWAGAAYLVVLGVQQWRAPAKPLTAGTQQPLAQRATAAELLRQGWLVNIVNPKGTVFLLAVLPQFLNLQQPLGLQYLILGLTLSFTDLVVMAGYTGLAASVLRALKSEQHMRWMNRVFGTLFIAAGAVLAVFKHGA